MEKIKRDSVVIYRNLFEALQEVPERAYKRVMNAVLKYAMDGEESELKGLEKSVFNLAKTQIDANNKRYENGKKGAEFGSRGGRPKKTTNPQENPTETPKIESYDELISDMEFSSSVENKVKEFIKHCLVNGHVLINSELNGILVELDLKYSTDEERITALSDAIKFGYFGLKKAVV